MPNKLGRTMTTTRIVHDSMGEIEIPATALYGAQTGRALDNFQISPLTMPFEFIQAMALLKYGCAKGNYELHLLPEDISLGIQQSGLEIYAGQYREQFPLDVFQTGSGTSTNMNVNEVIAFLATEKSHKPVHANDHVNLGQSSNDIIPSAIHLAASLAVETKLLPALHHLMQVITRKKDEIGTIITTGRTHLMDAVPIRYSQILEGWLGQFADNSDRIHSCLSRLHHLPLGGTAVGTGLNSHPQLATRACSHLSAYTGIPFTPMAHPCVGISSQDTAVELSGQLKTLGTTLMKISNDLRWLNSGPLAGLGEISLPPLQPGSSIMPGKINPVIPEAVAMVAAQVMGNDTTISVAGQSGNFQLNTMLPVIGYTLLQSIHILATACTHLGDKAIAGFAVHTDRIEQNLSKNPILATGLNPVIGYERGAEIVKAAYKQQRPILDVACEMTDLSREELQELLNPARLTQPHQPPKDSSRVINQEKRP